VGFDGLKIRHASRDDSGSVPSATELKVFLWPHFAIASATEWTIAPLVFKKTRPHGTRRKHNPFIVVEACLPRTTYKPPFFYCCVGVCCGRYLATHFPSRDRCIATVLHVTICLDFLFVDTSSETPIGPPFYQRWSDWIVKFVSFLGVMNA
jgi:hypothetical protein